VLWRFQNIYDSRIVAGCSINIFRVFIFTCRKEICMLLLGILNANRKIRKRTDTDVAFTREYSRVSIFHRERECTN